MAVETVWRGGALLGEGPVWDSARGVLWFVDIKARQVHRYDPRDGRVASWDAPAPVGWVLPSDDGALLAGLQTGLTRFDPADGSFAHVTAVEPDHPANRLNDATLGVGGEVWFGSMDDGETAATGRIYRWDGRNVAAAAIRPVCITNGPALSPDGSTLYHVDTVGGVIHAAPVLEDRSVGRARTFAVIDRAHGNPDGVTTDAEGNLWVGLWGGGRARLYSPAGEILREVAMPAANVTKIALGGADLMTAYATTARIGLSDKDRQTWPGSGDLFAFRVDVPGLDRPPALAARPLAGAATSRP